MKFGLFYETFVPADEPGAEARILRELVDRIRAPIRPPSPLYLT